MSEKTDQKSEKTKNQNQNRQGQYQKPDQLTKVLRMQKNTSQRIHKIEQGIENLDHRISAIENNQKEIIATQNQNHQMLKKLLKALEETENSDARELVTTVQTINNQTQQINSRTQRIEGEVSKESTGSSSGTGFN
jgi:inosine/xanthosine triphosphate pyrophosphatase family protein